MLTITLMEIGNGQVIEANPIAAHFLNEFGLLGLAGFKLMVVLFVLGLCFIIHRHRPNASIAVLVVGCTALTLVDAYSLGRILRVSPDPLTERTCHRAGNASTPKPLLDPQFLARLEQLELVSRKIFLGRMKGERRSKRKGQSVEFADYRNYVIGDDLRFLDWNLFARLDRLFIRLFMEEEDLHFYILIDNSLSMDFGSPTKLHYAKQVAAALGFIGLVNMDRVVIEAFNDRLTQSHAGGARPAQPVAAARFPAKARAGRAQRPAQGPAKLQPSSPAARASSSCSATSWTRAATRRPCATSSPGSSTSTSSRSCPRRRSSRTIVGDLKLVDVEDEDVAEITVSGPLLKRYKQNLAAYRAAIHEFCTRRGVSVPVHEQPGAVRPAGADLSAAARAGEVAAAGMRYALTPG